MATSIEEALSGGSLSVSAKPVAMEQLPDATIDVAGGSQALDISTPGSQKRKRTDPSIQTSSTSQLAIPDLFGDLLDQVDFANPVSVDAFRASAVNRINEFGPDTFDTIASSASTVTSDLDTLAGPLRVTPATQPAQQQFEQVFGPSRVTTGDDAEDISLDTTTSTELQDISDLTNPGLAASLFGGALGSFGRGANLTDFASGLATQGLGQADIVGAFGGFNTANALANANITDPFSAIAAVDAGIAVAGKAQQVQGLINQGMSLNSLFERAAKNVGEYIEGIYTAITNPDQAMEAFGRQMEFGTLTPSLFGFNLPSGRATFAFDQKTGLLVTPKFIETMLPTPLKTAFGLAQTAMGATGYTEEISNRAIGMTNAFSTAGISLGAATDSAAGMTGFADPSTQTNVNAIDINFTEVPGALDSLQFDMNALASQVAGRGVTANNISIEDLNQAAVVQTFPDFEEVEAYNTAIQNRFNEYANSRDIDNSIESIAEQIGIESVAASQAFAQDFNALAEAVGIKGVTLAYDSLKSMG